MTQAALSERPLRLMSTPEIHDTIRAAQQRDSRAFRQLVETYGNFTLSVAYGITGDFELARDVAQDTFVAAYRRLRELRNPDTFSGWLAAIARNKALNIIRSRARERQAIKARAQAQAEASEEPFEHDAVLEAALSELSDEYREAIALRHLDRRSLDEIAAILGMSVEGVKTRLSRGKRMLWEGIQRLRKQQQR